jgi:GT2 family glycosyltransferase
MGQDWDRPYEVIVADSSTDGTPDLVRRSVPAVTLLHRESRMQSGTARNLGVSAAQGRILMFTDADCIVPPDWLRRLVAHHRRRPEYAAVGGSTANGNPESTVSWAGYLAEFNIHLPGEGPPYQTAHIPTNNVSYKRWVFERYGGFPGNEVIKHVDLLFNHMLHHRGEKLLYDPSISVAHSHRTELGAYLAHQREIGRGTVQAMRRLPTIEGAWLARHPGLGLASLPAVVGVKFFRNSGRFVAWSPETVWRRPMTFPLFALGLAWWSAGFARELIRRCHPSELWLGNSQHGPKATTINENRRGKASPRPSDDIYGMSEPKAGLDNSVEVGDASPVQRG